MKKLLNTLFSPIFLALLLFLAAFFMGVATFVENDNGAAFAKATIYNTWWFELILILLTINLLGSIFTRKLYTKNKLPIFAFHFSFAIMLIGSGLTRYIGYEGMMHIREGQSSSIIRSQDKGLKIEISDKNGLKNDVFIKKELQKLESHSSVLNFGNDKITIAINKFHKNAFPGVIPNPKGKPVIGFIISSGQSRIFNYLEYDESLIVGSMNFAFNNNYSNEDVHFSYINDSLYLTAKLPHNHSSHAHNHAHNHEDELIKTHVVPNQIYHVNGMSIIVQEIYSQATVITKSNDNINKEEKIQALDIEIKYNESVEKMIIWHNSLVNIGPKTKTIGNMDVSLSYGDRIIELPFSIYLNKFEIERYPGSNSPSSFSSYVTINEPNVEPRPFHIYMNNILKLNGYRFFQSSYDKDEKGTILSVNYDIWGTTVTYIGYFLLIIGILLSLVIKHSFFKNADKVIKFLVLTIGFYFMSSNQELKAQNNTKKYVSEEHANEFGKLLIQNNQGRTEPIYTFSSELVRKISRSESLFGLTPVQTFLEMNLNYQEWTGLPIIKVSHDELKALIGVKSKYAAYNDFITHDGQYKLYQKVSEAYAKSPAKRTKFDKAILKADEKINICYSIFAGNYLKIFPQLDTLSEEWLTANDVLKTARTKEDSMYLSSILPAYFKEISNAKVSDNYTTADELLSGIKKYQNNYAKYNLPSEFKISVELAYYKWNIFKRLFPYYAFFGIVYLIVLVSGIIKGSETKPWVSKSFFTLIFLGFIGHTLGLAARWYISGHAPMSNGYESMIFIAWVTILAGFIFRRKLPLALSATSVLAAMTLMVANLSFMDPQITNLVPVLKSYWLTLHVSIITGSYSFLGLGAVLGIINQILFIYKNKSNKTRILNAVREITVINHQSLIIGLYFLTIGTFLGAIWANESWGRYWGWDPKETWSLITIIVYTFVTHARLIPGVKGLFTFNILSLYGFSSVLMTYFGVNYYLSGMHSYGGGDPIPVPTFVYYTIAILFTLSIVAYLKNKKEN